MNDDDASRLRALRRPGFRTGLGRARRRKLPDLSSSVDVEQPVALLQTQLMGYVIQIFLLTWLSQNQKS